MKIGFLGFDLPEGKVKYQDERLQQIAEKFAPQKVTPLFVEFLKEDFTNCDCIIVAKAKSLDFFILDMDKLDTRMQRAADDKEKELLKKCLSHLEKETPLCDVEFDAAEQALITPIAPCSLKPTLIEEALPSPNQIIEAILAKAGVILFYTANKKEVRAWPIAKDADIISGAAKIHSDLARGFIKADVINFAEFAGEHNMQAAKSTGKVQLVGRDYKLQDGDIIEIRFNV